MTREEAIHCLSVHSSTNGSGLCTDEQHYEAKQMAIKALDQEPSGDLISRKALTSHIENQSREWGEDYDVQQILGDIEDMPSINPQEPKWIPVSERLPEIHKDVILSLRSLETAIGFRAKTEPYFYCHGADGCYIEPQNVLAWQPLPEPYNAESEDKE